MGWGEGGRRGREEIAPELREEEERRGSGGKWRGAGGGERGNEEGQN